MLLANNMGFGVFFFSNKDELFCNIWEDVTADLDSNPWPPSEIPRRYHLTTSIGRNGFIFFKLSNYVLDANNI